MPYGIYSVPVACLESRREGVFDGQSFTNCSASHILTDAEKSFFYDNGFELCDFKWGGLSLVKCIGTPSIDYITLGVKHNPYRFVGFISRISESIPTVHGTFQLSTNIDEVEADTLFDCYEKLMVNLRKILEIEKENYIKYVDSIMNFDRKETEVVK